VPSRAPSLTRRGRDHHGNCPNSKKGAGSLFSRQSSLTRTKVFHVSGADEFLFYGCLYLGAGRSQGRGDGARRPAASRCGIPKTLRKRVYQSRRNPHSETPGQA
jgi:hypothetical protein